MGRESAASWYGCHPSQQEFETNPYIANNRLRASQMHILGAPNVLTAPKI